MTKKSQNSYPPDRNLARRHLDYLGYRPGERVYLRFFYHSNDPRKGNDAGRKASQLNWEEIENYQLQGRGVYVVVNGRGGGHADGDIDRCCAIFCEWDDLPLDEQLHRWEEIGFVEPTFVVFSGDKSMQPYWVFDEPVSVEQWRELQELLIATMGADPSNKNPSRVFRLAGGWHVKPGREPVKSEIVRDSGIRYSCGELRDRLLELQPSLSEQPSLPLEIAPQQQKPPSTLQERPRRYEDVRVPVPVPVPLECALGKTREFLGGVSSQRNTSMAALARDLLGTANEFELLGQTASDDPYTLFIDACRRCSPGGGWGEREWEQIWKSAARSHPTSSIGHKISPEAVRNCIKGWYWQNVAKPGSESPLIPKASERSNAQTKMPLEEAADAARQILANGKDEISIEIELEELRLQTGKSEYWWRNNFIKPLKRDMDAERFKLELLGLLQMEDEVERVRQIALLAPKYSMSATSVKEAMAAMKQRTQSPEVRVLDFGQLLDTSSQAVDWLVPGLLPVGESVLLYALPKVGKSKLAIDLAFCTATGESKFLGQKVKQGKVLLIMPDASEQSLKQELLKRGFRKQDARNLHVMPRWSIDQLAVLESELEDFRPDLVVIDSLKRITAGKEISENSAEFADNIIALNELLTRYRAAGILVHHANKGSDAVGVEKARGSTAIVGAGWGAWELARIPKQDPNNKKKMMVDPKCPKRILTVTGRDCEGTTLSIEFNAENNSWDFFAEAGVDPEEARQQQTYRERILKVLRANSHRELSGCEIMELLGVGREQRGSTYSELNRMENKRLISVRPAPGDKRYNLYSLPDFTPPTGTTDSPDEESQKSLPPPPPTLTVSVANSSSESLTENQLENSQQNSQQVVSSNGECDSFKNAKSPDSKGVYPIVSNLQLSQGGGGVKCSPDSETVTPASAPLAHSHPIAHPANSAGAIELQNPPAAQCEPEPIAPNAGGVQKDRTQNPSPVECETSSIALSPNPTGSDDRVQNPSPVDLETDPIAPNAEGVQNPLSVECEPSSIAPNANPTADNRVQNPPPTADDRVQNSPPTRTESDSLAPSGNPKDSDANATVEPELNEDELFLISCIRSLVAETESKDASEAALDLLPVFSETCNSGAADREKVWQALTASERAAFKALLSSGPAAAPSAPPEPHSPIEPADAQQIREIAEIWWDELPEQSLLTQLAGHVRKYGFAAIAGWLAVQNDALVRERIGRLLERFN
ncbi:AAA family ATPase [Microcoleus sp. PH2017_28_MFU_U_A]|uniref:AAA family ATPase n=1 Tax=Microcoleus sp. PH2017_28_MFU_U_A TaxID=2798838 RepID=UPI001D2566D4|nr:AAA family ATPase [Microcoleus sp. PH2017_28_MFU_U_A]MCC3593843.1 AAA family ATPase [Microcoleus sp. PH2017_28_MFU_U_A]